MEPKDYDLRPTAVTRPPDAYFAAFLAFIVSALSLAVWAFISLL